MGFSLGVASRSSSLDAVHGLLIATTSLVSEDGLKSAWASVVVAQRLSCPVACGIFLGHDQTHGSHELCLHPSPGLQRDPEIFHIFNAFSYN